MSDRTGQDQKRRTSIADHVERQAHREMVASLAAQRCRWCGREGRWPLICLNTRDMTERAINGEDTCYTALEKQGGGESGMRYVDLNRAARK